MQWVIGNACRLGASRVVPRERSFVGTRKPAAPPSQSRQPTNERVLACRCAYHSELIPPSPNSAAWLAGPPELFASRCCAPCPVRSLPRQATEPCMARRIARGAAGRGALCTHLGRCAGDCASLTRGCRLLDISEAARTPKGSDGHSIPEPVSHGTREHGLFRPL